MQQDKVNIQHTSSKEKIKEMQEDQFEKNLQIWIY